MMRIDLINRPTQALLAATVILSLVVALQWLYPARPARAALATTQDTDAGLPEFDAVALNPPHMADLASMLERPLFYADRRMPEQPKTETATVAPLTPLRLKLEGVAITGESRVAVLRNLSDNQLLQLTEGMAHDGWTLDAVSSNGANFSRGEQVTELPLDPGTNGRRR
ncbi:MAG: hypothetical protein OEO82_00580 [Gammaproteobacteria bacterium]|nr:hypothetical protein [Gammaproteobacteria bacterium]